MIWQFYLRKITFSSFNKTMITVWKIIQIRKQSYTGKLDLFNLVVLFYLFFTNLMIIQSDHYKWLNRKKLK